MTETAMGSGDLPTAKQPFNWRVFLIGLALVLVAALVAIPFVRALLAATQEAPSFVGLVSFAAQQWLGGAIALALGLYLGPRIGLGFSLIPGWVRGERVAGRALQVLQVGLVVAILGAVSVILLGSLAVLLALALGTDVAALTDAQTMALFESYPAPWKWLLISLNAGIIEEIFFRLGLLTLLAWLGGLAWRDARGRPAEAVFWAADFLSGLVFGVAHLFGGIPYPKEPVIMVRIVVQNTALGMILGWLYRRWGLECAMLAHFLIDVVFYVVLVPSLRSLNPWWMLAALVGLVLAFVWAWRGQRRRAREGVPAT